ncbi:hypothetical protein ACTJI2_16515 [Pseudoxanthomonas sp. 22568]|uniref:hypothetical protein n=1 Tax=Pseudoxanthomonas sp. 22568 TaxID=3453945 RepID=UPI00296F6534|nr:hypothetical protein LAG73_17790 [Pseudoxanthomonas japonensis]
MRKFHVSVLVMSFACVPLAPAQADDQVAPLQCDIGPLQRTYGGTEWVVYACSDKKTVVIYTDSSNPGKDFFFMFTPKDGQLQLYGEGNGDKKYTAAAFDELKSMTQDDVDALIKETGTTMPPPASGN